MQQIEMSNKLHSERDELLVIDSLACVNIQCMWSCLILMYMLYIPLNAHFFPFLLF